MADNSKKTQDNNSQENQKFEIKVTEKEEFPETYSGHVTTSVDLCKLISSLFRTIYADFEGCQFKFDKANRPTISLFFNQIDSKMKDPNKIYATDQEIPEDKKKKGGTSTLIGRRRTMDARRQFGDRFYLTNEGKEGITKFLYGDKFNRDGKVNWGDICIPIATDTQRGMYPYTQPKQMTEVAGLDPVKLLNEIYGTEEGGKTYTHQVIVQCSIGTSFNNGYVNSNNFLLNIQRICDQETESIGLQAGIIGNSVVSGLVK